VFSLIFGAAALFTTLVGTGIAIQHNSTQAGRDAERLELEKKKLELERQREYNSILGQIGDTDTNITGLKGDIAQAGIDISEALGEISTYQNWLDNFDSYYEQTIGGMENDINTFTANQRNEYETLEQQITRLNENTASALDTIRGNIGTLDFNTNDALENFNSDIRGIKENAASALSKYNENAGELNYQTKTDLDALNAGIRGVKENAKTALDQYNESVGELGYQTKTDLDALNAGIRGVNENAKTALDQYNAAIGDLTSNYNSTIGNLNAQIAEQKFSGEQTFRQFAETLGYADALAGATGRTGGLTSIGAVGRRAKEDIIAYAGSDMSLVGDDGVYGARMRFLKDGVLQTVLDYERHTGEAKTAISDLIGGNLDLENLGGSYGADIADFMTRIRDLVGDDMIMGGEKSGRYEARLDSLKTQIADLIGGDLDLENLGGSYGADIADVMTRIRDLVGDDMAMGGAEGRYERRLGSLESDITSLIGENLDAENPGGSYGADIADVMTKIRNLAGDDMVMGGAEGQYERELAAYRKQITDLVGEDVTADGTGGSYASELSYLQSRIRSLAGEDMIFDETGGTYGNTLASLNRDLQQAVREIYDERDANERQLDIWKKTLTASKETMTDTHTALTQAEEEKEGFVKQLQELYPDLIGKFDDYERLGVVNPGEVLENLFGKFKGALRGVGRSFMWDSAGTTDEPAEVMPIDRLLDVINLNF
jgi:hypothetical protein